MDQSNELSNEAGDRKSLVISRRQLFEQINADRNVNRVVYKKPVSPGSSSSSDVDDDVNCVNSNSVSGIENREKQSNRDVCPKNYENRSKKQSENLKFLHLPNDSPCSKRISYNIAVSNGEFGKILPRQPPAAIIDESDHEDAFEKLINGDHLTINEDEFAKILPREQSENQIFEECDRDDEPEKLQNGENSSTISKELVEIIPHDESNHEEEEPKNDHINEEKPAEILPQQCDHEEEEPKSDHINEEKPAEILPQQCDHGEEESKNDRINEEKPAELIPQRRSDHVPEKLRIYSHTTRSENEPVKILPPEHPEMIIEESDREVDIANNHTSDSNDTVSDVNTDQTTTKIPTVNVVDENIEDLSNTKLAENNLSVISSSRITNNSNAHHTDTKCQKSKSHKDYPQELNPFGDDDEESTDKNPFNSDDDDEAPRISTNPFGSGSEDEDEPNSDSLSLKKTPVPLPRTVKKPIALSPQPSPKPRIRSANNVSPSPSQRSFQSCRKLSSDSSDVSFQRSPGSQSVNSTLIRKKKPAPPPPPVAAKIANVNESQNRSNERIDKTNVEQTPRKSTPSPWKNKKGPAPARPIPIRRPVKEMPIEDIKTELCDIEIRQQELDRQGKQLEEMIRDRTNTDNPEDTSSSEELVVQLFEIVNEKNELLRRHSELMYMRKMHNLEEEHAEIEYQLRCLMLQPEINKTDSDKTKEEELLRRLLEVVERRNEIIEAMEKDRLRETAEDKSVTTQLEENKSDHDEKQHKKMKKSKKEKVKEHKEEESSKSPDSKHSPSKVIKQKFMTLRHSAKKLNTKIPH